MALVRPPTYKKTFQDAFFLANKGTVEAKGHGVIHKMCSAAYEALDPVVRAAGELAANQELLAFFTLAGDEKNVVAYTKLVTARVAKRKAEATKLEGADPSWMPFKVGVWRRPKDGREGEYTYATSPGFDTAEALYAALPPKPVKKRKMDALRLFVKQNTAKLGGRVKCVAAWSLMVGDRASERATYQAETDRMNGVGAGEEAVIPLPEEEEEE